MKLSGSSCCSVQLLRKPGLNVNLLQKPQLSMKLSRKPELSMKLSRKPELSISCRESLYMYIIAFGYKKKIIRPKGPAKKIILLQNCPKKNSWPGKKFQAPPPPPQNIKWTVPKTCSTPLKYGYFIPHTVYIHKFGFLVLKLFLETLCFTLQGLNRVLIINSQDFGRHC